MVKGLLINRVKGVTKIITKVISSSNEDFGTGRYFVTFIQIKSLIFFGQGVGGGLRGKK